MKVASSPSSRAVQRLWLVVASVLVLHVICYKAAAPLRSSSQLSHLVKRSAPFEVSNPPAGEEAGSLIAYQEIYYNASPAARPFVFAAMIVWLVFLFAFVGITASDFFCPNLNTIAGRLGLSESVAGVTFLAFSNGSPDVFSTFAALRTNSGALAIGELLGAASFIVSVVAGTMCLIQPFRVARHTFLRDVGFFTVAVSFTLAILWDSHIHGWEAIGMVGLYLIYVVVVAAGSWWMARKERREERIREARSEYAVESGEYRDEPVPTPRPQSTRSNSGVASPALSYSFPSASHSASLHPHQHNALDQETFVSQAERGASVTLTRTRSGSTTIHSPTVRRPQSRSTVRPSLLGAIEFRDVVNSLRADSSARTLAVFGGAGEEHTHASLVGSEAGIFDRGANGPKAQGRPGRSASHTGAERPEFSANGQVVSDPRNSLQDLRRPSWTPDRRMARSEDGNVEHWEEGSEEGSEVGAEDTLIDLSPGAENPWQDARTRAGLRIEIPRRKSNAASTRALRTPIAPLLARKASGGSTTSTGKAIRRVPSILLTSAAGDQITVHDAPPPPLQPSSISLSNHHGYHVSRAVFLALFPSLQDFSDKSCLGKATAILCVPAILVLNLTLPVVDTEEADCVSVEEKERFAKRPKYEDDDSYSDELERDNDDSLLVDTSDPHPPHHHFTRAEARNAVALQLHSHVLPHPELDSPAMWATPLDVDSLERGLEAFSFASENGTVNKVPPSEEQSSTPSEDGLTPPGTPAIVLVHEDVLTRWLTVVQCTLGPVFCTTALLADDLVWWCPLAALGVGVVLASIAYYHFEDHRHPGRIVLCFLGFFVAAVWILKIVNEVVGVLQTFGHIFGLSDAILGLTIFAMGNSLGDLVANATVARMGFPSMAIAACFGGPMLNILLGVGLSGSYMIYSNNGEAYHIEMGRTLIVSGIGLLLILVTTLIAVPLNGYWMNQRLGACLIGAYACVLTTTVAVEVFF